MVEEGPSFESTPSWVIGAVVFVIVGFSLGIDKLLSKLGQHLDDKKPLQKALEKIKEELMLMGFVSLLLAFVQDNVQHWCIPEKYVDYWLPCHSNDAGSSLQIFLSSYRRRRLLGEEGEDFACKKGLVPFIGLGVLHDLHYLIFVLAVVHVSSCTITVLLGKAKISQWAKWECDIQLKKPENVESGEVILTKQLTFVKDRYGDGNAAWFRRNYVNSFIKHLLGVVTKADYEAMRFGFIVAHHEGDHNYNFHDYVIYAYEADFQKVVTIRWFLWLFAVISLTLHVAGWNIYFWISLIPLSFKFDFNSCIMGDRNFAIARLVIMVAVQTIFSYSTLPLYAIVTRMGSSDNKDATERSRIGSTHRRNMSAEHSVSESSHRRSGN
ncbi:MLO-like protein 15 isoform X3 [Silene latifolia]|uniref:MLO-like protein 15 isoform X3 n=1 Tax=Silene latifolia TaxID=37657 RepID=UPI003D786DEE